MSISQLNDGLRIELDTKHCRLSSRQIARLEADLTTLERLVRSFPLASLNVTISRHPRTSRYQVKTSLRLPGRDLCTGDWDVQYHPAFERCTRKLMHKVTAYKQAIAHQDDQRKETMGTQHSVIPIYEPDALALQQAIDDSNYIAFCMALSAYEEPLRRRAAQRVERYPRLAARLGQNLSLDDIVEEVFLHAFDRFHERPLLPLGAWLEHQIDHAIRALIQRPDEEHENIHFARTLRETVTAEKTNGIPQTRTVR